MINKFNEFRLSKGADKIKFLTFKISDDKKRVVLDKESKETDYEAFRTELENAKTDKGVPAPRYAVYDVEYDLGGGEGKRYEFLHWSPFSSNPSI